MDPWQDTPEPPAFAPPEPLAQGQARRGLTGLAWGLVVLAVAFKVVAPRFAGPETTEIGPDPVGELLIGIQGRYLVGAAAFTPQREILYQQVEALDVGSLGQRLRVVVLAAELGGPQKARHHLDALRSDVKTQSDRGRIEPDEADLEVLRVLGLIYPDPAESPEPEGDAPPARERVSESARVLLLDRLGWFGELALSPGDAGARDDALGRANRTFILIVSVFGAAIAAGAGGFAGLISLVVLAVMGRLRSGVGAGGSHHGIYAETFAIWLVAFLMLQLVAGAIASLAPEAHLLIVLGTFFVSLFVLAWPCVRGIPWRQVRQDIGWTLGRAPLLEPIMGVVGYAMALPILAVGVLVTFLFLLLDASLAGDPELLAPAGGPAHPIVAELGSGDWWLLVQILLLGSVAAPVIEETMFRGVLYRHLRDASRGWGPFSSVLLSSIINAFVFAIIHPQGWIAVPALMSLAIAFSLAREWRGSLIPAMIIHGVSNGVVLGLITILATI